MREKIIEDFWVNKLDGELSKIIFPVFNKSENGLISELRENISIPIPKNITENMDKVSKGSGTALFTLYLTGLFVLLRRYVKVDDLIVGTLDLGLESDNGRILFCRNKLDKEISLKGLIGNVKKDVIDSFNYSDYTLEKVENKVREKTGKLDLDIYNIAFIYDNIQKWGKNLEKFDLAISLSKKESDYSLTANYNLNVHSKEIVENFIRNFIQFFSEFNSKLESKISTIDSLNKEEYDKLVSFTGRKNKSVGDITSIDLFEEACIKTPEKTAIEFEGTKLSYKQLNERSNKLANYLLERGVQKGDVVGLLIDRSVEMIDAIIAILKAGGAYLPIDPKYPKKRMLDMLDDCEVKLLITTDNCLEIIEYTKLKNLNPDKVVIHRTKPRTPVDNIDSFPIPDRSLIDYEKYHQYIGNAPAKNTISLISSRGCPYQCIYCHQIWPNKSFQRSAENIFEEVKHFYEMGMRRFVFLDDIFNLNKKNSSRFLEMILRNNYDVQLFFPNGLRGDILTDEYIKLLVEAGTVNFSVALETATPRLQTMIKKNLKIDKFLENIYNITENYPQIILEMELMIGFPSETEQEAMDTLNLLKSFKYVHFPNLNILKIYPNSEMSQIALEHGIPHEMIKRSANLSFHELPDTLPYPKKFAREYQSQYMTEYFLLKERFLHVLPYQMKVLREDELIRKYDSYLPMEINSFSDILNVAGIKRDELGDIKLLDKDFMKVENFNQKIRSKTVVKKKDPNAIKVLMLDLSQFFNSEAGKMLYDVVEPPLGLMYLLTYLNKNYESGVDGKILKSRTDFDSFEELKKYITEFKPDLISIRTLSYYKDFFHRTVNLLKKWLPEVSIITGGPYATTDYTTILADENVDMVILGEGELTMNELVGAMIQNNHKLPAKDQLNEIAGLVYRTKESSTREILMLDRLGEEVDLCSSKNPEKIASGDDLAYVLYTSGSTGTPKGVAMPHRPLSNLISWQNRQERFSLGRTTLQFSPFVFDVFFQEIFSTLSTGGKLVLCSDDTRMDTMAMLKYLKDHAIERLFLPFVGLQQLALIADNYENIPTSLKEIVTAGDQLKVTPALIKFMNKQDDCTLHNHYGPIECHVVTTYSNDADITKWDKLPPIGIPIDNARIYILDESLSMLPIGVEGDLYIGGESVADGYINNDELTKQKFIENPFIKGERLYNTGDLARWMPDGNIEFLGRSDHQVKVRGFRIEVGEIENKLLEISYIESAVVVANENVQGEKFLCAYLVSAKELDMGHVKILLSEILPYYMIPSFFIQIKKIPLTATGKLDGKSLPDPLKSSSTQGDTYVAPQGDYEKRIAEIWKEVLGVERVGSNDNFFELGGNSLNIVLVSKKIIEVFNIEMTAVSLFNYPTVNSLTKFLEMGSNGKEVVEASPERKKAVSAGKNFMKGRIMR